MAELSLFSLKWENFCLTYYAAALERMFNQAILKWGSDRFHPTFEIA